MSTTPFSQQLANLAKGTIDAELTEELARLVKSINAHMKKGSITLTLNLKPEVAGGEVQMITMLADIKSKHPQPQRMGSRLWPTFDGDLLRDDPDQTTLDLKQVDTTTGEIKEL